MREEVHMKLRTLREVCAETGVTRRTIQGYEKLGLLNPIGKNDSGWLLYDEQCLCQIREIKFLQNIGLSRKEIVLYQSQKLEKKIEILVSKQSDLQKELTFKQIMLGEIKNKIETLGSFRGDFSGI